MFIIAGEITPAFSIAVDGGTFTSKTTFVYKHTLGVHLSPRTSYFFKHGKSASWHR